MEVALFFMKHTFLLTSAFLICFLALSLKLSAAKLPTGFIEERIAENLDPTTMAFAPDGRIFIAEKNGRIRIVENGILLEDPFLEIEVDNFNERGLGGLAFHPNYDQNNWVYITYTVPGENHNRISRFTANGNYALPESEVILLELPPLSGTIHNGGALAFGADGKLYAAIGDGSNAPSAQNLNSLLGKFIRINDDGTIPEDNPFYNVLLGDNRAIFAYGFRNPFTFAIQPETGRIFANEVGSEFYEEVNHIQAGKNYGWDQFEGYYSGNNAPEDYQDPLYAYSHNIGCATIGATFYNPALATFPPEYHGKYFFGDYCEGYIKVLDPETGVIQETFARDINRPIALLVAPNGDMYYLDRPGIGDGSMLDNTSSSGSSLWRISYDGSGAPFIADQPHDVLVTIGETASFSILANGADPLSFQWLKNGDTIPGATQSSYIIPNCQLADDGSTFSCIVSNTVSTATSQVALLTVTSNRRPLVEITSPATDELYQAGNTIFFSGQAEDPEDGNLDPAQLTWRIDFHHNDHTHPALDRLSGTYQGEFLIPQIGETDDNVWYRIYLTATDEFGLSQTTYKDILPRKSNIEVKTEPTGLLVNIDGKAVEGPYTFKSVVGVQHTLRAPTTQEKDGRLYVFSGWTDGYENFIRNIIAPETDQSLTANYDEIITGNGQGLLGAYFNDPEFLFSNKPVLYRLDSTINFDWVFGTPEEGVVDNDFFTIRWTGYVEPYFTENYTFYTVTDDGVRLWVDDELIIDQWVPQGATEVRGNISLEAGKRHRIVMEYFEAAGHAVAKLGWWSQRTPRQIIPSRQLYPDDLYFAQAGDYAYIYPNPFGQRLNIALSNYKPANYEIEVLDAKGRLLAKRNINHGIQQTNLELDTSAWAPGMYFVRIMQGNNGEVYKVIKR